MSFKARVFFFLPSSALWNVYPVESANYSTGVEPIPPGSAERKIFILFGNMKSVLCDFAVNYYESSRALVRLPDRRLKALKKR